MTHLLTGYRLPGRPAYGVDGIVRALVAAYGPGSPVALDEARVLSGVAFRVYMFTPDDNHAWRETYPGQEWRWATLSMDSYGVAESLTTHLDRDIRRWEAPDNATLWTLVRGEVGGGRALVGISGDERREAFVIDGTKRNGDVERLAEAGPGDFALDLGDIAADAKTPSGLTAVLTLRPPTEPATESRRRALMRDVVEFAVRHATTGRELDFGEEAYFASGGRAMEVTADLLETRAVAELEEGETDLPAFFSSFAADLSDGRTAAAEVLARWARLEPPLLDGPEGAAALAETAKSFGRVAAIAQPLAETPAGVDAAAGLRVLREAERTATSRLRGRENRS